MALTGQSVPASGSGGHASHASVSYSGHFVSSSTAGGGSSARLAPRDGGDHHDGWGHSGVIGEGNDSNPILTNRDCVYFTNRDCVYEDDYHPGDVSTHGGDAVDRIDCVSSSDCTVALKLTVTEHLRNGRVFAVTPDLGHGHRGDNARLGHRNHAGSGHHGHGHHGHAHGSKGHRGKHHGHGSKGHHGHKGKHHGKPKLSTRQVTVGSGSLTLAAKHHASYKVALNAAGSRLLRHFHKLHARLNVTVTSGQAKVGNTHAGVVTFKRH